MKDRYRKRRGLPPLKGTTWNNRKSRVELDDGIPLGSASWIGKDRGKEFELKNPGYKDRPTGTARGGPWFEPKNQGFDYQKNRWRPKRKHSARRSGTPWFRYVPLGLGLLLIAIPMLRDAKRQGWVPDIEQETPFPGSGSVTVARSLDMDRVTSWLEVQANSANAVVQLFEPDTKKHVISVYVRGDDHVRVRVPRGLYEVRLIEGRKWHGTVRFFGSSTTYETVAAPQRFPHQGGFGIDLRRRPHGGLPTRLMMNDPDKL
ncbi:hypothetical protein [Novosphingobium sp. 9U]|uniref:hypothetical protein n=1 Tax=Novosphingobium sp. 9U TaxID=2653158 RepID=UPI001F32BF3F|nr:hypothetical protein [Novosphingobium sp. 9U]